MYSFTNDYSESAHQNILDALQNTFMEQNVGYGLDEHTENAKEIVKNLIDRDDVDIHILVGGTQTNAICIASFLRPHEAAICVETGHINVHETGAIEASGHKVIGVASPDGKITSDMIQEVVDKHIDEHMVKPKLVYISQSTELGTVYNLKELKEIRQCCDKNNLLLYLDGARLASGLMSEETDMTLSDIARYCDAFYIGGTKSGALFGEMVVICKESLKEDFRYIIKQRGALLAKGMLLGIQFEELFKDNLFFELGKHANKMSLKIKEAIKEAGYEFIAESSTNQLFPILPNKLVENLTKEFSFGDIDKYSENMSTFRIVTSWATKVEEVEKLIKIIREY